MHFVGSLWGVRARAEAWSCSDDTLPPGTKMLLRYAGQSTVMQLAQLGAPFLDKKSQWWALLCNGCTLRDFQALKHLHIWKPSA